MRRRILLLFFAVLAIGGGAVWYVAYRDRFPFSFENLPFQRAVVFQNADITQDLTLTEPQSLSSVTPPIPFGAVYDLEEPIDEFGERLTKKPFGIFITKGSSPVQPERFQGYHTGVDIEYDDVTADVPVRAIADGAVVVSRFAKGYGGVMVIQHSINQKPLLALYGHLDPKSMLPLNAAVAKRQTIGILGEHRTEETDGVRKHLHFAILKKDIVDIQGYVKNKEELAEWYNPIDFFPDLAQRLKK